MNEQGEAMPSVEHDAPQRMSETERLVAELDQKIKELESRVAAGDPAAERKVQELYNQKQHVLHN